jgi:hypothetical protein
MKRLHLVVASAVACCAFSYSAVAATVSLTELNWYSSPLNVNAPVIGNVAADSSSGVFNQTVIGNQLPNARSPYDENNDGNANAPYSVISWGGSSAASAGSATYNLGGATTFRLLWGSPDTYNFVTFYDISNNPIATTGASGTDFIGTDLVQCGATCDQLHWDLVLFTSDVALGKVVLSDSGQKAFEYAVAATPLPAALPLFASGLGVLGFAGWRKRKKAKNAS